MLIKRSSAKEVDIIKDKSKQNLDRKFVSHTPYFRT